MDPVKAKFYQANFEIESGGRSLSGRGLVSESGITKIHFSQIDAFWQGLVGKSVTLRLERMEIQAVLLRQVVENGAFYELRFRGLLGSYADFIRQRIAAEGISPGWQRAFPRIPVTETQDVDLPVPSLCMVHFLGQEVFVNVVNFTLGGIRIETLGDELKELKVGSVIQFDLGTSNGAVLPGVFGEVRNISELEHKEKADHPVTRAVGLKLVNWNPVNERKYRELIKDYCLALQKRFQG